MALISDIPDAIQWHEGMLLTPQHFQQLSVRNEELLNYHLMAVTPFYWGFRELIIDEDALLQGKLKVLKLEAVMPDGLLIKHSNNEGELSIDLEAGDETIYIAVYKRKKGSNVGKYIEDQCRFKSIEGDTVMDETNGIMGSDPIPRLKPWISLKREDELRGSLECLPIARVVNYEKNAFKLTEYVPPVLQITTHWKKIWEMCNNLLKTVKEKAITLSNKISSFDQSTGEGKIDLNIKLNFRSIVSALPYYEAVLTTEKSHPYSVYLSLCALAGNIASVDPVEMPSFSFAYNHEEIHEIFEQVIEFIQRRVDEGVQETHDIYRFKFKDGRFYLTLKNEWKTDRLILGVRRPRSMSEEKLIEWMAKCYIASGLELKDSEGDKIQLMIEQRVPGAKRDNIDSDGEYSPPRGVTFFAVATTNPDGIKYIDFDEIMQVFHPETSETEMKPPEEIALYIRKKQ